MYQIKVKLKTSKNSREFLKLGFLHTLAGAVHTVTLPTAAHASAVGAPSLWLH